MGLSRYSFDVPAAFRLAAAGSTRREIADALGVGYRSIAYLFRRFPDKAPAHQYGREAPRSQRGPLTVGRLVEMLAYDPTTGQWRWLRQSQGNMRDDRAGSRSTDGYIDIKIDGRTYRAHRLAWLYTYGRWPTGQIDHRNGVRDDNRINNLRDVSRDVNAQNQRQAHRGKSTNLPIGVYPPDPRWGSSGYTAQIGVGGKKIKLGTFTTVGEAYAAYVSAKRRLHEGCTL